jgi:pimeloyl-ACP methyl ester carboxylesterase
MEFLAVPQESSQPEIAEAFVNVAGARLHYLHAGIGPPMLLIHGLVGSSQNWLNNINALAGSASVYAPDLLNMGKSQRVNGLDTRLKATANRMVASMDALGLAAVDIVAHSHGGAIALMLAAQRPQRVRRLILFAPANPYSKSGDCLVRFYSSPWGGLALRMLPYLPAPIQRIALGKLYGGPDRVIESCLQTYTEVLRDSSTVHHVLSILRCWFVERSKLRRALRRVAQIPTLLVWGDRDCTVSLSSGIRLHRRLRASELIVVPERGHSVFEEAPEEANRIMLEWLGRHPLPATLPAPLPAAPAAYPRRRNRAQAVPYAASASIGVAQAGAAPGMEKLSSET